MFSRALPRSLEITPSYDLPLPCSYVLQQLYKEYRDYSTDSTKHCTPEKFFMWKHVCLFVKGQMSHKIGKILAEIEWSSLFSTMGDLIDSVMYLSIVACLCVCEFIGPAAFDPLPDLTREGLSIKIPVNVTLTLTASCNLKHVISR